MCFRLFNVLTLTLYNNYWEQKVEYHVTDISTLRQTDLGSVDDQLGDEVLDVVVSPWTP